MKVLIADDEIRICQLIEILIDWKSLGLEVAGVANNGVEAYEKVQELKPDILITDIRMPGCSGLELIEKVKKISPELEVIVISGYAHFEYAQQAMRYGVVDYILKPISKTEMTSTLEKLTAKIRNKQVMNRNRDDLIEQNRKDAKKLQQELLWRLLENEEKPTAQSLKETYYLQIRPGLFQVFYLKTDCRQDSLRNGSLATVMEKAQSIFEGALRPKCFEMILDCRDLICVGIVNYEEERQEEIRRILKGCLGQLELQKSLFSQIEFSIALGTAVKEPELLGESLQEASQLIQERLVKGTGRLLEHMGPPSELHRSNILEKYLREIGGAVETLSEEQSHKAVRILEDEISTVKDAHGYEVIDIVRSAAEIFTVRTQMTDPEERLEKFRLLSDDCSSVSDLLSCLLEFQDTYLRELSAQYEEDTVRPIRKAKQFMQEHYAEPITQEQVSNEVGLSAAYFSALFKKTEGEGFVKHLTNLRMEQAKILLRESNLPMNEICQRVGYSDQKHFAKTFEKTTGIRPGTYRKLYG